MEVSRIDRPATGASSTFLIRAAALFLLLCLSLSLLGIQSAAAFDSLHYLLAVAAVAVHEVGHVVFRPFGETLYTLGGTIAQLSLPLFLILWAIQARDRLLCSFSLYYLSLNLLEVARYIADARARRLVTLSLGIWPNQPGEGPHDWFIMLSRFDLLAFDTRIADIVWRLGIVALGLAYVAMLTPRSYLPWVADEGRSRVRDLERASVADVRTPAIVATTK